MPNGKEVIGEVNALKNRQNQNQLFTTIMDTWVTSLHASFSTLQLFRTFIFLTLTKKKPIKMSKNLIKTQPFLRQIALTGKSQRVIHASIHASEPHIINGVIIFPLLTLFPF